MGPMVNAITVDVEEYFHATEVQNALDATARASLPSRLQHQVHNTLELFGNKHVKATFFILGWVAERLPSLVREITQAGHEIACHSYWHRLIYKLNCSTKPHPRIMRVPALIRESCVAG